MLIDIRISELQSNTSNSIPLTIIIGFFFCYYLFQFMPYNIAIFNNFNSTNQNKILDLKAYNLFINQESYLEKKIDSSNLANLVVSPQKNRLIYVTSNTWENFLGDINHLTGIGNVMYTIYNIWLVLASLILLLAMVGCIVITINPKSSYSEDSSESISI